MKIDINEYELFPAYEMRLPDEDGFIWGVIVELKSEKYEDYLKVTEAYDKVRKELRILYEKKEVQ